MLKLIFNIKQVKKNIFYVVYAIRTKISEENLARSKNMLTHVNSSVIGVYCSQLLSYFMLTANLPYLKIWIKWPIFGH